MRYWLEVKPDLKRGFTLTTVYRQLANGTYQEGNDRAYASWKGSYRFRTEGLFSADLPEGLTIADAASALRKAKEEAEQ